MIFHSSLEFSLLLLVIEFGVAACILMFLLLRRSRAQEQTQTAAVTTLVAKVEATTDARREALTAIFGETYGFDPQETERIVSDFIERERAFYNAMISVHLGRGGKTLGDVPAELTKVVAPWLRLTPKNMLDSGAVEVLETTNRTLSQELAQTKIVLDALMEEYNAAFHKGQIAAQQPAGPSSHLPATPAPAAAEIEPPAAVAEMFDDVPTAAEVAAQLGDIIELDLDLTDPSLVAPLPPGVAQLTPNDLDALMENLDVEYKSVAA